jgi:dihydrolipoamide dehydrogenase
VTSPDAFDVAVIGSGPGGYVAAIRAAQLGLRTAVVERDPAGCGGTCLQRGCIPTKALLHSADLYEDMLRATEFGLRADNVSVDLAAVMKRKARIVKRLSKGIESYLFKKHGITLFKGEGRLDGPGTVVVSSPGGEVRLSTKSVVLATGSRPRSLPGVVPDGRAILTSDHALEIEVLPKSLIVIGAGAVGIEFASIFARFGSKVTVVELLPRVLPLEDEEISAEARKLLARQMEILTGARTESAVATAEGVELVLTDPDGASRTLSAERVLVAVGRGPVTEGLGLESTRIKLDRGLVRVAPTLQTDEPGVYAIGDVITVNGAPHPQLAHVASHEGTAVAERIAGRPTPPLDYGRIPSATYSRPEVASVGLTEAAARAQGRDVKVGRFPFGSLAKPRILGHEGGFVKVVAETRYDEVLGVHMIGPHATDLISEACLALQLEASTEEIRRTVHPHPTLPEALAQAAEAVYGHAIDA